MQMQVGDRCVISAEEGISATSTVSTADGKYKRCGTGIGSFEESYPGNKQVLKHETTHI